MCLLAHKQKTQINLFGIQVSILVESLDDLQDLHLHPDLRRELLTVTCVGENRREESSLALTDVLL